jgi:hypothetical protein
MNLHGDESPGMASVAKLDGVTAKLKGGIMLLRLLIKMALFAVFPGPVRIYDLVSSFCCDKVTVSARNQKQAEAQ